MPTIWTWGGPKTVWGGSRPNLGNITKPGPKPKPPRPVSHAPSLGYITLVSYPEAHDFTALLGDQVPNITGGAGGWVMKPRARRHSFTVWDGVDPIQLDIPILFDNWADGRGKNLEADILELEYMAGIIGGGQPPFVLFNSGGVVPHDYHGDPFRDWVIEDLTWGDAERNKEGNRLRQAVTIKLRQYLEDDPIIQGSPAQQAKAKKKAKQKKAAGKRVNKKFHVVKGARENLESIAAAEHVSWHKLKELNHIRDPKKILNQGKTIKLR